MPRKHIYYVYRITNTIKKKHYYGYRKCYCDPREDIGIKYFSSSKDKDFKKDQLENYQNYRYKIIKIYDNKEDALLLEIKLHGKFNVGANENFYNRSKQTSTKWSTAGKAAVKWADGRDNSTFLVNIDDHRYKSGELVSIKKDKHKGKNNPMYGKKGDLCPSYGIIRSEETRNKMRQKRKENYKEVTCPHCKTKGEERAMNMWHFDNCGKTNRNKGSNNGKAKIINIYNAFGFLIFKCHGNFTKICKENNIPIKPMSNSYKNNGKPIMLSNLSIKKAIKMQTTQYIEWFAFEEH